MLHDCSDCQHTIRCVGQRLHILGIGKKINFIAARSKCHIIFIIIYCTLIPAGIMSVTMF